METPDKLDYSTSYSLNRVHAATMLGIITRSDPQQEIRIRYMRNLAAMNASSINTYLERVKVAAADGFLFNDLTQRYSKLNAQTQLDFEKLTSLTGEHQSDMVSYAIRTMIIIMIITAIIGAVLGRVLVHYFQTSLNRMLAITDEYAKGNYSNQHQNVSNKYGQDEMTELASRIIDLGGTMRDIIGRVTHESNAVLGTTKQFQQITDSLAQGSAQQASGAEQVSSTMEEIAASFDQISQNAVQAQGIATEMEPYVQTTSTEADRALKSLEQIAGRITLINDIADQTTS